MDSASVSGPDKVLAVDLDRTLIKTDMLEEAVFMYLKKRPWALFNVIFALLKGRVHLKNFLASAVTINPQLLPYNEKVLDRIKSARENGYHVVLVSASHASFVKPIADHVGLFDHFIGTKDKNIKGSAKLDTLKSLYPKAKIEYLGDSSADIVLWKGFGTAHTVNASRSSIASLKSANIPVEVIDDTRKLNLKIIRKSLRAHQWVKNFLVLLPLLLAHAWQQDLWTVSLLAFVSFSFTASSIYILNDLFDLEADRAHKKKRLRPFASGDLSISQGVILYALVSILAIVFALLINVGFLTCLLIYFIANLTYTLRLKQVHSLDIIMLAGMYTIRIMAGSQATGIEVSEWLIGFSTFLFYGLAALKRYVEVSSLGAAQKAAGRGYIGDDKFTLAALGCASSLMACLVLALYFNSTAVLDLYRNPKLLWLILPLHLYWVSSVWILASRGKIDDDPVLHTIKSKSTYVLAALAGIVIYFAV